MYVAIFNQNRRSKSIRVVSLLSLVSAGVAGYWGAIGMAVDMPCASYLALYIVSMHILSTNSRTSTHHWKLNVAEDKVQAAPVANPDEAGDHLLDGVPVDPMLSILTNKVTLNGEWKLDGESTCHEDCVRRKPTETNGSANSSNGSKKETTEPTSNTSSTTSKKEKKKVVLDCGKAVNFTQFDHLSGIANRKNHPNIPEPEVAMIFKKTYSRNAEVDMNEVERRLRKLKKEKPKSWQVYNQIGNFWRIKGHTQLSIECFRKALSLDSKNSDVLLNLARVLYNLQYLDDAIFLTRRSLEMQSPDKNTWLQHFTLGEILKAYGHYHEATLHFRHTLDLNPGFQPAQAHLREMEVNPDGTVTYYTLFIILFLVLGVLCGILTSIDGNLEELGETIKTQRHFNRAMAMRSIKLGINPKLIRMRKQYNC